MDCTLQPWTQINASFLKLLWSSIVTHQVKQLIHRLSFLWHASTPRLSINEQYSFVCTCQALSISQSADVDLGSFHFCCYRQWLYEHTYTVFAQTCLSAFEFVPSRENAWSFCVEYLRNCQAIFHSTEVRSYICHGTCHLLLVLWLFPTGHGPLTMSDTEGTAHSPQPTFMCSVHDIA